MHLRCILFLFGAVSSAVGFDFEGDKAKRSEPLTRHKMVHCFDENVKILGPKSFEVEKRNKNEETKMSIIRQKRRAGCTVKTIVTDDEPDELNDGRTHHHHRHHQHSHSPPENFNTKTSYSLSKSVTSTPVQIDFDARQSSSSSSESEISSHEEDENRDGLQTGQELPTVPHLPAIPHIGHEATYPNPVGKGDARDADFEGEEPGPGEKTITFKTNTHRHETVDQTGFVREKTNGYPVRPNDDWRARFKDMPYLADENGRVISSGAESSVGFRLPRAEVVAALLLHYAIAVFLVS